MNNEILEPIINMAISTFVMMIWMYATRIPTSKYIEKKGIDLQDLSHPSNLGVVFPSKVERVADNYNHLFEQPTIFYIIILIIWAFNLKDTFYLSCAWIYFLLEKFTLFFKQH